MTDLERDARLERIDAKFGRMESTMAKMRKEAPDAHEAIGERIHSSFMALDRGMDGEISNLNNKIDAFGTRPSDAGR